jgi:DNA-binding GntR family transcriptional regulator
VEITSPTGGSSETLSRRHQTLRELVADEIRAMIMRGQLGPGERLLEDRIAEQLGVSRNPVREAIRALEATGLVEVRPRRGAYVTEFDLEDLRALLELRSLLEAYAAELAAQRRDDEDLSELDRCVREGRSAAARQDHVSAADCHRDFHLAIERASGNRHLEAVVAPLRDQTELVFSVLLDQRGPMGWDEHEAIRQAISDGDPSAAREHTRQHMRSVIRDLERSAVSGP